MKKKQPKETKEFGKMKSADYKSTREQLEEAIKNIRPTYNVNSLTAALFSLAFEYLGIKLRLMHYGLRYKARYGLRYKK